jgi:hypothetical protein
MSRAPLPLRSILAFLAVLVVVAPALGQGTSGSLPDPVSGEDLSAYARRLGLSAEQRLAVDRFHEDYLAEFGALREREIDEFLQNTGQLMRSFMFNPDSKRVREAMNDYNRLIGRITALDDRLFSQMQGMLSEEQMALVPRARQMRERARYRTGLVRMLTFQNPGARVDLSEVVELMRLDEADRAAIDPSLREYEGQLTSATRRLSETTSSMFVDAVKEIESLNLEPSGRNWQAIGEVWREASTGAVTRASDISTLNRRTVRSLGPLMTENGSRDLTGAYRELAYPDVHRGMVRTIGLYESALAMTALPDETRTSVEAGLRGLRDQHERLAEQMIDIHEEQRRTASMFRWGRRNAGDDELEPLRERRDELNERAMESLFALLGPDRADELRERMADTEGDEKEAATILALSRGGGATVVATRREPETAPRGPDPYVPGPITTGDVTTIADRLGIDEGRRAVLQSLHDDYLDEFEGLRTERIEPIVEMRRRLWERKDDEAPGPTKADVDALFDMRRAAIDEILALDEAFFDDVALTAVDRDDDAGQALLPRLADERRRAVYARAGAPSSRPGMPGQRRFSRSWMVEENGEAMVDLGRIVREADLSADEREDVEALIIGYEREMTDRFRRRSEIGFELDQGMERLNASGGDQRSGWRAYRELLQTKGRTLSEAETAISSANRSALEELRATLPAASFSVVEDAYRRRAYPQVYDDPASAEPHLLAALELEDLSESQREEIRDILGEYRGPYRSLCLRMVDVHASALEETDGDERNRWQQRGQRRNDLEKLQFDRGELNDKSLRRLRAALREDQTQRLGLEAEDA